MVRPLLFQESKANRIPSTVRPVRASAQDQRSERVEQEVWYHLDLAPRSLGQRKPGVMTGVMDFKWRSRNDGCTHPGVRWYSS